MSAHELDKLTDEQSFEMLFRTYYKVLVQFASQYVTDIDTAEEIVQETFANFWDKLDRIHIKTSVKSYLYGAVRNACLNYLKHLNVRANHATEIKYTADYADGNDFLELEELKTKIENALNQLPEKCRTVFEMSRFEQKKYREIAQILSISEKTVENQMGKALKILRVELGEYLTLWLLFILWNGGKL